MAKDEKFFKNISQEERDFLVSVADKVDRGEQPSQEELMKYLRLCKKDHPMHFYAGNVKALEELRKKCEESEKKKKK